MPVNYKDVEMLQNSMQNLGNSFAQNRQLKEQREQRSIENSLRERMLTNQEAAQKRSSSGRVTTYLQGLDGVVLGFEGDPTALQTFQAESEAKGKPLKSVSKPAAGAHPWQIAGNFPSAKVTAYARDFQEAQKVLDEFGKAGAKSEQPGQMETADTRRAIYEAALERDAATDPAKKRELEIFRANKASKTDPTEYETVTEDDPGFEGKEAVPGVPPSHREIFGIKIPGTSNPGTPGTPAIPARPKQSVSYKRPRGAAMTPPPTVPNAAPATAEKVRVIAPDGTPGMIPRQQLDAALAQGYKLAK